MEGIAKAASHFRDGSFFDDSGSTIGQVDFEFDSLLINTAVYRHAFQQYIERSSCLGPEDRTLNEAGEISQNDGGRPMVEPQATQAILTETHSSIHVFNLSAFWEALRAGDIAVLDELSLQPDFIDLNLAYERTNIAGYRELPLYHVIEWYNELEKPMDALQWLLEHGALPNFRVPARGEYGSTALHKVIIDVAIYDQVKVAELLIKYGADVTLKMDDGSTALHGAVEWGALDMVKFLLENGASVIARDDWGRTPCTVPFLDRGCNERPITEYVKEEIRRICAEHAKLEV